jgi:hypothetical protein
VGQAGLDPATRCLEGGICRRWLPDWLPEIHLPSLMLERAKTVSIMPGTAAVVSAIQLRDGFTGGHALTGRKTTSIDAKEFRGRPTSLAVAGCLVIIGSRTLQ